MIVVQYMLALFEEVGRVFHKGYYPHPGERHIHANKI